MHTPEVPNQSSKQEETGSMWYSSRTVEPRIKATEIPIA